jgi:hypothetical protein
LARPSRRFGSRRAISAPAAAVVIVAIISASAVSVFWIGISSRSSGGAPSVTTVTVTVTQVSSSTVTVSTSQPGGTQVSVADVTTPAAAFSTEGRTTAFTCNLLAGQGAYLEVANAGADAVTLTGVTITWAGANNEFTPPPASCQVGAAGSNTALLYVNLPDPAMLTVGAVGGQNFTGALALENGTEVPFSGTFLLG